MKHEPLLTVETHRDGPTATVVPCGDLDISTAPWVDAAIRRALDAGARDVVLDLRRLSFMDSTGVRLMLQWDAEARRDGMHFSAIRGEPGVQRTLALSGIENIVSWRPAQ